MKNCFNKDIHGYKKYIEANLAIEKDILYKVDGDKIEIDLQK